MKRCDERGMGRRSDRVVDPQPRGIMISGVPTMIDDDARSSEGGKVGSRRRKQPGARWRVPPPIRYGYESLPGQAVLEELGGAVGAELWHLLRATQLWARSRQEIRPTLFVASVWDDPGRESPESFRGAMTALSRVVTASEACSADEISSACRDIAVWADREGHWGTAVEFAQVRTELTPTDPVAAYQVGRLARRRGETARAESWLRHAVYLSRVSRDLTAYARANLGLGNLFAERGSLPAARKTLLRTLRAARKAKSTELTGMALHDLFQVAAQRGQVGVATRYARVAARSYGAGHPRLPVLFKDLAFLWLESGWFRSSLDLLLVVAPGVHGIPERRLLYSATARAAAGLGDSVLYDASARDAAALFGGGDVGEAMSPALLNLAFGAAMLGRAEDARALGARAEAAARVASEGKVRFDTEQLLAELAARDRQCHLPKTEASVIDASVSEAIALLAGVR